MAFFALDVGVFSQQRETALSVVEKCFCPAAFIVAAFAFLAFLPLVLIVLRMASVANGLCLVAIEHAAVAARALDRLVLAAQRILRIAIVIELDDFPVFFSVTRLTFVAETGLVGVVFFVAADAGGGELFRVDKPGMAGAAFRQDMLTVERVLGIAGVIEDQRFPIFVYVAGRTLVAETCLVFVIQIGRASCRERVWRYV